VAHEKAVDGEIAALDVFLGRLRIDDLVRMAAIGVPDIGTKCGDFDFEGILANEDDAELGADVESKGEELKHFPRRGVGGNVIIGGLAMKQDIAHATADQQGLVAVSLKREANRVGEFAGIHGMIMRLWRDVNEVEEVKEVEEGDVATENSHTCGSRIRSSGERDR
jgi:hypothetical protein